MDKIIRQVIGWAVMVVPALALILTGRNYGLLLTVVSCVSIMVGLSILDWKPQLAAGKMPLRGDYETEEEYEKALRGWEDYWNQKEDENRGN